MYFFAVQGTLSSPTIASIMSEINGSLFPNIYYLMNELAVLLETTCKADRINSALG